MATSVSELYVKRLPLTIKCPDREDRKCHITLSIELVTNTAPVHRKELVFRLTDTTDRFFLYTLKLNEEEFQSLKTQQGLLVDFASFPKAVIDLSEKCQQEEHKESPRYVMDLVANGTSTGSTANLDVIETDSICRRSYMSLKFMPGTDADIKKYLAECLKTLENQLKSVSQKLEHTESDLSQQLRQAREALSARTVELDSLKTEWGTRINDINMKHRQELAQEKETSLQKERETQERNERERREIEQNHNKVMRQADAKMCELEASVKELTDGKYKRDGTIHEQSTRILTLEEENARFKHELQMLRKNNSSLDSEYHEMQKTINQLKTNLAVAEKDLESKEQRIQSLAQQLATEQQQMKKSEEEVERKKRHLGKAESSLKKMSDELCKGNEIIAKLQGDIRNYHNKLKLRNHVVMEQEKLIGDNKTEMEQMRTELKETKNTLCLKDDEIRTLNDKNDSTMKKLEENLALLKHNERVIEFMQKKLTEYEVNGYRGGRSSGPFELTSSGMSHGRPAGALTGQPHTSTADHGFSSRMSTSSNMASLGPKPNHTQVSYQHAPVTGSKTLIPIAKSSPIDAIPEHQAQEQPRRTKSQQAHTASPHLQTRPQSTDGILEKYLQKTTEKPLREVRAHSPPPSLHFNQGTPVPSSSHPHPPPSSQHQPPHPHQHQTNNLYSSGATGRIPRDVITGANNYGGAKPKPPLASAYFQQGS